MCLSSVLLRSLLLAILFTCGLPSASQAEVYVLRENLIDTRTFEILVQVQAQGKLKTPVKENAAADLPLDLQAQLGYQERRLPAAGRDDRAWRSLRVYQQATSQITVKEQKTQLKLTNGIQEVVAEGMRTGLLLYAPQQLLQRKDIDLLNLPADPLATLAILPTTDVELEESWNIPDWAAQMLVGVEAATSAMLTGKLVSVDAEKKVAHLQIVGEVSGAITGAATKVVLNGTAEFDLQAGYLRSLKVIQREQRGISTVSPGMDVTATIQWKRQPVATPEQLSDFRVKQIPLDPPDFSNRLQFRSQHWQIQLKHDRDWHVFQEIPEVAVLRLVKAGSLISQCNVAKIPKMKAGQHVDPDKFVSDIKVSLGEQLSQIVDTQEVPTEDGKFIYRVVAAGGSDDLQMVWIYYLCANPDGRQISFVFAVEQSNLEILNSQDLAMVGSVEFLGE